MKTKSFLVRSRNYQAKVRAAVSEASVFKPEPEQKIQNLELQSQNQNKYFNLCQKSKPSKEHLFSLITSETRQRGVIQFLEALPCNRATKPTKSQRLNAMPELILKTEFYPCGFLQGEFYPKRFSHRCTHFSCHNPKGQIQSSSHHVAINFCGDYGKAFKRCNKVSRCEFSGGVGFW